MLVCCKTDLDPGLLERAGRLCSRQRLEKAARIADPQARAASLTAGLLADYCLKKSGAGQSELLFTPGGRPYLADDRLFLSLSHSGRYAACAVSHRPVGVDIQRVTPVGFKVVRRVCTPAEQRALAAGGDLTRGFIRLWALKESWLKACGARPSEMFAAEFSVGETVTGPQGYAFRLFEQIDGYVLALCEKK